MSEHATLPLPLSILGGDGNFQTLLKAGARLPAQARAVFATQRAGQRELSFKLYEGEGSAEKAALVGAVEVELPPGLPPNTWMNVFCEVRADLSLRISVKENLRRIHIDAALDASERKATMLGG
jgi:molecular chaperone DnaK (HSP70)